MKKILILFIGMVLIVSGIVIVMAQTPEFNVCCEKTINGAWCQNTQDGQCDEGFRKTPTSCDATSYCKLGVCVDTIEGICLENTPQKVCEIDGGTWIDDSVEETPQCNLGCCTLGNQASFVTQTRCKRLSRLYGLETDFRTDITDESTCVLTAYSSEQGACVFDGDGEKTCVLTSRGDCTNRNVEGNNTGTGDAEFFKDYLCSADELATNCGPTEETVCIDGRDEVYFKDSCGNAANIYDSSKAEDPAYWRNIVAKEDSCDYGDKKGNAGDKSCGNCDYLSGSICQKGEAIIGDLICKDLNCYNTENGKNYRNGESWCIYQAATGDGQDPAGSRHFRHVCIHGEETIEPCGDFRNEVCIQTELGTNRGSFIEAACRVNRWVDCIDQHEEDDCLNTDKRDCRWLEDYSYDGSSSSTAGTQAIQGANENNQFNNGQTPGNPAGSPIVDPNTADQDPEGENLGIIRGGDGLCLPRYPPGLEHWQDSNAGQICSLGNSRQVVKFEEGLFGDKKCSENCDVLTGEWVEEMNNICLSIGDCGNYINVRGVYTDDGILVKDNGQTRKISQGIADAAFQEDEGFLGGLFG